MKKIIDFGKIDYNGSGRKNCTVTIELELRKKGGEEVFTLDAEGKKKYTGEITPVYYEFSACGNIYNPSRSDIYICGQCLDEIAEYIKDPLFTEIYDLWKNYHLNGMNAGTPEQEEAIKKMESGTYNYKTACEYLKNIGLYEVKYTGLSIGRVYNNELYRYGHAWLIRELPQDIINRITEILA